MKYWLMKSEPGDLSIDGLRDLPLQQIDWFGIRNYQARNFMRDDMSVGDMVIFWHSSCKNPGIYGIAKVCRDAHPDETQFDITNKYYDAKATVAKPIWWCVDIQFVSQSKYISISQLRKYYELAEMKVLRRGNRLSITPVTSSEWDFIQNLI